MSGGYFISKYTHERNVCPTIKFKSRNKYFSIEFKNTIMKTIKKIIWNIFLAIMILLALYRLTAYSQSETEAKEFYSSSAEKIIEKLNFKLHDCSPEKFSEVTTLQFDIFEETQAKLTINNKEGEIMETLCEGIMEPGTYKVYFKASKDLSSGEYICKLESNGSHQTKKIFLLRH